MARDPYATLGLQPGASDEDAKSAFRKLAKTCHPDLHPNDPQAEGRFKEINEAYSAITQGAPGAEPFHFRAGGFNFRVDDIFGTPFDDIFGHARRNMDTHLECRLTLEECFYGKDLTIQIPAGRSTRAINVTIPPGMQHGMRISIPRAGSQLNPTVPPGDLFVAVHIMPHNRFSREGNNLVMMHPVTAFDVLLGKEIVVVGIDGRSFTVTIPSGWDSARKLRLTGQGMPDVHTSNRGDLLIDLFVQYPELNDEQRLLIRQAADGILI